MSHSPAPLSELIAVDLGRGLATAMATRILLSLGVRVIRFRELGDDPFDLIYPAHRSWHAGKKLVDARPGSVAFADAIATADICITGGEDHPDLPDLPAPNVLGAMNPRLVVAEILGAPAALGDTVPAVDILAQARSGLMFEELTDRPIFSALPYPSYSAAFLLTTGLLAALFARERAGTGGIVSTSLFEGALAIAAPLYLTAAQAGSRFDLVPPKSPRHMIFRCADDRYLQLVMGVAGAKSKLYSALGLDTLGIDPSDRGLDAKDPMKFYGDAAFFAPFFLDRDSEAMAAALNEAGIPNAEVLGPGSAWKESQVKALAMFTEGEDGSRFPASPFSLRVEQTDRRPTTSAESRTNPNAGPLSGVRILDLGAWIAGPLASVPLVDLGAEVIKVEPIEGDPHRFVQRSFAASNRGKRSIAIDLKSERGMAAFRKLIATADVLVHNFRPGVAERLGIGAATLHALQPSLVVLESSAYGHNGPRSQRPGFDQLF